MHCSSSNLNAGILDSLRLPVAGMILLTDSLKHFLRPSFWFDKQSEPPFA